MLSEERLRNVLAKVEGVSDVFIGREGSDFMAVVVSSAFEGKEEHERQNEVWGLLLDNLNDVEQAQVRFVFTNTPEEKAQAERAALAGE